MVWDPGLLVVSSLENNLFIIWVTEATLGNEFGAEVFVLEWTDSEEPIEGFLRILLNPEAEKCIPDTASSLLSCYTNIKSLDQTFDNSIQNNHF